MSLRLSSRCARALVLALLASPAVSWAQAWVAPSDEGLREALERLVDDRVLDLPLLAWPIASRELKAGLEAARARTGLSAAQLSAIARIDAALAPDPRQWFVAAGDPSDLRTFEDAPRESAELGAAWRWRGNARFTGEFRVRAALHPNDDQVARLDGSYLAARTGNWLWTAGFQDRWWGGGYNGSLQLSSNARPVFALSLDRETSQPFESRWLSWLGPWTIGTFFGALENRRPDSNHALLWGARASARPLPGLEFSVTRNAQFCGDKPPCSPKAFWNVLVGNDNVGESVSAADEPGNQLATYEIRWAGKIGEMPLGLYWQHTGETIDNKIPRPLRALDLITLSTWGDTAAGGRWRAHLEASSTTCADFSSVQSADCAYENGVFSAGYRYRGRVFGHSTDSDSRQLVVGLVYSAPTDWIWTARLRRAEINRIGFVPQGNHLLSKGPALWWVGEGTMERPLLGGNLELAVGLERRRDDRSRATQLDPRGYLRWTQRF